MCGANASHISRISCVRMYVCIYVSIYLSMYVSMYVWKCERVLQAKYSLSIGRNDVKFSMIILWSTTNVFRYTWILHTDFHSRVYVHRPPKWICKRSTVNLLDRMMWSLVWWYFKVLRMITNLLALCMLIFIVVHTCTDPRNKLASIVLQIF